MYKAFTDKTPATTAAAATEEKMAHLAQEEIEECRETARTEILAVTAQYPGCKWYVFVCPCNIDCGHMPTEEIPIIMLSRCHYPGELDYFFVEQPFFATYTFKV